MPIAGCRGSAGHAVRAAEPRRSVRHADEPVRAGHGQDRPQARHRDERRPGRRGSTDGLTQRFEARDVRDMTLTAAPDFKTRAATGSATRRIRYLYRSSTNATATLDAAVDAFRALERAARRLPVPDVHTSSSRPVATGWSHHGSSGSRTASARRTCATSSPTRPPTSGSTAWSATTRHASRSPTRRPPTSSPASVTGTKRGQPLLDRAAGPLDLRLHRGVLLRAGSTSRAGTCSTRHAGAWARPVLDGAPRATSRRIATSCRTNETLLDLAGRADATQPRRSLFDSRVPVDLLIEAAADVAMRRSAASACGICRNEAGRIGRHAAPAGHEPGRARRDAGGRPGSRTRRGPTAGSRSSDGHSVQSYSGASGAAAAPGRPGSGGWRIDRGQVPSGRRRRGPGRPDRASGRRTPGTRRGRRVDRVRDPEGRPDGPHLGVEPVGVRWLAAARASARRPPASSRRAWRGPTAPASGSRAVVAGAADAPVQGVAAAGSRRAPPAWSRTRCADSCAACRPAGATGRPEVGVLGDAGRDRRMGELQEQGAWAGAEEEHRLAIEPPGDRVRARTGRRRSRRPMRSRSAVRSGRDRRD